jgi:hypothetical protein
MPDFDPDFAAPADFARFYRSLGMQVVPAHMPKDTGQWKRPALANWREFQTSLVPQSQFDRWYGPQGEFRHHRNMGFLTGVATTEGFVYWILDLDFQKGPEARQWLEGILHLHNNGMGFGTPLLRTGGGGYQYLFRASANWRPPTGKTPIGVDIRGVGGFAMLAPSMHLSGHPYGYVNGQAPWEAEIEESPKWLEDAVDALLAALSEDAETPRRDDWAIRDRAIVLTALLTGLRLDELVGLNIGDIRAVQSGAIQHIRSKAQAFGPGRDGPASLKRRIQFFPRSGQIDYPTTLGYKVVGNRSRKGAGRTRHDHHPPAYIKQVIHTHHPTRPSHAIQH